MKWGMIDLVRVIFLREKENTKSKENTEAPKQSLTISHNDKMTTKWCKVTIVINYRLITVYLLFRVQL